MSKLRVSQIQHPSSQDPNLSINQDGSIQADKINSEEISASSLKHPNSPSNQITMNADGSVDVAGLATQESVNQTQIAQEKALTPDINNEYTLALEDVGKVLTLDDADSEKAVTVNVPPDSEVDFGVGSKVSLYRDNEAELRITPNENVTLKSNIGTFDFFRLDKYGEIQLRKRAQNEWVITESGLIKPIFAVGGDDVFTEEIGGNIYRIHVFTTPGSSQTLDILSGGGEIEYLVIAGGGGGGAGTSGSTGGGGGAGGYRSSVKGERSGRDTDPEPPLIVSVGLYSVVVGTGGTAGGSSSNGGKGGDSSFNNIVSEGGGLGGRSDGVASGSGGSGGGRSWLGTPGSGVAGQGFDGSNWNSGGSGGGGGGAGEQPTGASGGSGIASSITGTSVTRAVGGSSNANGSASANTGNGGFSQTSPRTGAAGGSGIVIVRYRIG